MERRVAEKPQDPGYVEKTYYEKDFLAAPLRIDPRPPSPILPIWADMHLGGFFTSLETRLYQMDSPFFQELCAEICRIPAILTGYSCIG